MRTMQPRFSPCSLALSILAMLAFVLAGLDGSPQALAADAVKSSNPLSGDAAAIDHGKTLYRSICGPCHGMKADGKGRGIAGASNLRTFKRGFTRYVEIVKNGKKKMPAYGGGRTLTDEEISQIGAYLETLARQGARWHDAK